MNEPTLHIKQEQDQDGFKGEEAVKTVRARCAQGCPGDINQPGCDDQKTYQLYAHDSKPINIIVSLKAAKKTKIYIV